MKTAWIFPGGSARGVYTAGVIYALSKMNVEKPDMIIAASASAPTSVCYITGQYEIIPKVWLELLSTRKFVSFLRFWKVLNIDYLIDVVLKERNHLDIKKLADSDITLYVPLTDAKTGKIEYTSNKTKLDMWEVLRASISIPIWTNLFSVMGNPVNGKFYSDSAPATRYPSHVSKAIKEGMERIIVFDNWLPDDNPAPYFVSKAFTYLRGSEYRKNQLDYYREINNFSIPKNVEFVKIEPKAKLGMGRFEINNKNARKIFKCGYDDTLNNKKLFVIAKK